MNVTEMLYCTEDTALPPYRSWWLVPIAWTGQPAVDVLRQEEALNPDKRCHLGSSWRGAETLSIEEPAVVSETLRFGHSQRQLVSFA